MWVTVSIIGYVLGREIISQKIDYSHKQKKMEPTLKADSILIYQYLIFT